VLIILGRWLWKSQTGKDELVDWKDLGSVLFTFFLVVLGWLVFRAGNLSEAGNYLSSLLSATTSLSVGMPAFGKMAIIYCFLLVVIEWVQRRRLGPLQLDGSWLGRYRWSRWLVYYLVFMLMFFCRGEEQTFIYFQF
jgi:hypothetical protein